MLERESFRNIDPKKYEETQNYLRNEGKNVKKIFEKIVDQIENERFQKNNMYGEYMTFNMDNIFEETSIKDPEKRLAVLSKCSSSINHLGHYIDSKNNNIPGTFKIRPKPKEEY